MNWRMFFMVFWSVAAVLTFLALGSYVYGATTEEGYNMEFIAKDIAFGLTTAMSVEGDVNIVYNIPSKFEIEVENGVVTLKYDNFQKKANYVQNNKYKLEIERKAGLIHFKKRGVR